MTLRSSAYSSATYDTLWSPFDTPLTIFYGARTNPVAALSFSHAMTVSYQWRRTDLNRRSLGYGPSGDGRTPPLRFVCFIVSCACAVMELNHPSLRRLIYSQARCPYGITTLVARFKSEQTGVSNGVRTRDIRDHNAALYLTELYPPCATFPSSDCSCRTLTVYWDLTSVRGGHLFVARGTQTCCQPGALCARGITISRPAVCRTAALPLSYKRLATATGLEPATPG